MKTQLIEKNDSEAVSRRVKYIELSIVTITALLALIALELPKELVLSVLLLMASILITLFSFVFDKFVEKMIVAEDDGNTILTSRLFNAWDWVYFGTYGLAVLFFCFVVIDQYLC